MKSIVYEMLEGAKSWCEDNEGFIKRLTATIRRGWGSDSAERGEEQNDLLAAALDREYASGRLKRERPGIHCNHEPPSVGDAVVTVGGEVRRGPNANRDEFPGWDDCRVGSAADKAAASVAAGSSEDPRASSPTHECPPHSGTAPHSRAARHAAPKHEDPVDCAECGKPYATMGKLCASCFAEKAEKRNDPAPGTPPWKPTITMGECCWPGCERATERPPMCEPHRRDMAGGHCPAPLDGEDYDDRNTCATVGCRNTVHSAGRCAECYEGEVPVRSNLSVLTNLGVKEYTNEEIDSAFDAFILGGELFSRDELEEELKKQYPFRVMTAKVWKNALLRHRRAGKVEVIRQGVYQHPEGE